MSPPPAVRVRWKSFDCTGPGKHYFSLSLPSLTVPLIQAEVLDEVDIAPAQAHVLDPPTMVAGWGWGQAVSGAGSIASLEALMTTDPPYQHVGTKGSRQLLLSCTLAESPWTLATSQSPVQNEVQP